jgi:hypothetical protein
VRDDHFEEVLLARRDGGFERRDRHVLIPLENVPGVVADVGVRASAIWRTISAVSCIPIASVSVTGCAGQNSG